MVLVLVLIGLLLTGTFFAKPAGRAIRDDHSSLLGLQGRLRLPTTWWRRLAICGLPSP
jgi:hypothetical protein